MGFLKNKKGQQQNILVVVALALISLVALQQLGIFSIGGAQGGTAAPGGTVKVELTGDTSCGVDQTTLSTKNYNKYVPTSALTDGNAFWRLYVTNGENRGDQGLFADSGTKALSPGNKIEIVAGDNSSTRFAQKISKEVACEGTLDIIAKLAPVDVAPTVVYENANGQVNTGQDLAANQVYSFKETWTATSQRAMGNPYLKDLCTSGTKNACNVVCYQFNTTVTDAVNVKGLMAAGAAFNSESTSIPRGVANNITGAGFATNCWTFPSIEDGQRMEYTLEIDTAATEPGAVNAINRSIAYADYGRHTLTGAELIGIDDNDFVAIAPNSPLFIVTNVVDTN